MVSIETLVKVYTNFGERQKLSPLLSADEMLFEPNLTKKQINWIERFIIVWDYTTNLDVQLCKRKLIMAKLKRSNNGKNKKTR
tara:strand:- start:445 stop:693 length:249 start_codon:yes stop_codon:yes gene_type:complete